MKYLEGPRKKQFGEKQSLFKSGQRSESRSGGARPESAPAAHARVYKTTPRDTSADHSPRASSKQLGPLPMKKRPATSKTRRDEKTTQKERHRPASGKFLKDITDSDQPSELLEGTSSSNKPALTQQPPRPASARSSSSSVKSSSSSSLSPRSSSSSSAAKSSKKKKSPKTSPRSSHADDAENVPRDDNKMAVASDPSLRNNDVTEQNDTASNIDQDDQPATSLVYDRETPKGMQPTSTEENTHEKASDETPADRAGAPADGTTSAQKSSSVQHTDNASTKSKDSVIVDLEKNEYTCGESYIAAKADDSAEETEEQAEPTSVNDAIENDADRDDAAGDDVTSDHGASDDKSAASQSSDEVSATDTCS